MTTVTIFGRLTKNPEKKTTNDKEYVAFGVASKSMHSNATEFFNCTSYSPNVIKFMTEYLVKGSPVCVTGEPRSFDGKGGVKVWYINVTNVEAMKDKFKYIED